MGATAMPARADGNSWQTHRQRNVGVCGSAVEMRANPQVRVYGAYGLQDVSVVAKLAAGQVTTSQSFRDDYIVDSFKAPPAKS